MFVHPVHPTIYEDMWNPGDALSDTSLYEHIEVVRGENGSWTSRATWQTC
jgi:outer membrane receptor for ferric coprogen and ferric-rhodotorulic acid